VAAGLVVGMFLAALESTVVATAMRRVVHELGGERLYALPFAFYMLMSTVTAPLWGRASDLVGRRRLYLAGVALFLLGSALCGAASSMGFLVAARGVQGLGGGALFTLTFTIIGELYAMERRAKVQGFISAVWGLAGLLGPLVGGLIVDHASWRWVFYLNLPFGLVGATLVMLGYRDRPAHAGARLDLAGAALFTLGSALLVWGLELRDPRWIVPGAIVLAAAFVVETRHPRPLLPLRLLGRGLPLVALSTGFLAGAAYFGSVAYLPLFAQGVAGTGAAAAGIVLTPMIVGWTIAAIAGARLLPGLGVMRLAVWGHALLVAGFLGFALGALAPLPWLGAAGFVAGSGMGFAMLALLVGTQEVVPPAELGAVTAALLFARSLGGALGVAVMHALIGPVGSAGGRALALGLRRAFVFGLGLVIVALVLVVAMPTAERRR
jgi:MFS family permease